MMKNLLSFLFVIAFLCCGALAVSAKTSSSPANSVAVSKRVLVANTKANSLKTRCKIGIGCSQELSILMAINAVYEYNCAPDYVTGCSPTLESMLTGAGDVYESCLSSPFLSKNTDRTMDRNKTEKSRDVTSR